MTEVLSTVINPDAPWSFIPDTIEGIMADMKTYVLDPVFEQYGNFCNRHPIWLKPELTEKYTGCAMIFGNFLTYSHAFRVLTDDEELITQFEELINANKSTAAYQTARCR